MPISHELDAHDAHTPQPSGPATPTLQLQTVGQAGEQPRPPANVLLENYQAYAQYPPTSRLVTQRRAEAFKYNHRPIQYLPVRADADGKIAMFSVFTADKFNVLPSESIAITLKATAAAEPRAASYPIQILRSGLSLGRGTDAVPVAELDLRDDGTGGDATAGDLTYTATVRPAAIEALADFHGSVRAFVEFSANGATHGQQLFFNAYPEKAVAANFSGVFRETVEDGSLVVYAQLEVLKAGHFDVDATLTSRDGTAFCHSRFKGWLDRGTREARLLFFGKVIRDAHPAALAPFRVTELYGQMVPPPDRIAQATQAGDFAPAIVPLYGRDYITRPYDVSTFSDAEWQSTDKQTRLSDYAGLAAP